MGLLIRQWFSNWTGGFSHLVTYSTRPFSKAEIYIQVKLSVRLLRVFESLTFSTIQTPPLHVSPWHYRKSYGQLRILGILKATYKVAENGPIFFAEKAKWWWGELRWWRDVWIVMKTISKRSSPYTRPLIAYCLLFIVNMNKLYRQGNGIVWPSCFVMGKSSRWD